MISRKNGVKYLYVNRTQHSLPFLAKAFEYNGDSLICLKGKFLQFCLAKFIVVLIEHVPCTVLFDIKYLINQVFALECVL